MIPKGSRVLVDTVAVVYFLEEADPLRCPRSGDARRRGDGRPARYPSRAKVFTKREGAGFSPTLLFDGAAGSRLLRGGVGYHSPERFRIVLDYPIGGHYPQTSSRDYVRHTISSRPYHTT